MEDQEIIGLYFKREEKAIKETAAKYGKLAQRIAGAILNDRRDIEECTADVYLALWQSIPPQQPTNFKAFIAKLTRNHALKRYSYNHAAKRDSYLETDFNELADILPDTKIPQAVRDEEIARVLSDFLRRMKAETRAIFIAKYWYFDDLKTIAERYSYSLPKVKSILFQARKQLKERLKKEGLLNDSANR